MGIFQKSVLKSFVREQTKTNSEAIQNAYQKFVVHFGDKSVQENLSKVKEEQYQEGFLKDLFVNVLDYTLFPNQNHNLVTELKNPNDSKKADGGILSDNQKGNPAKNTVLAVIELKDMRTRLMASIENQAFGYKRQHPNCRYVITSNFRFLRFYLDNAYEHEEFDLFDLDYDNFTILYTLLQKDNLLSGLPLQLKKQSVAREEELTLEFYNRYQLSKELIFLSLARQNKKFDALLLFEKTQKLLDRLIFMCFAKDKGLLPPNLIQTIIEEWKNRIEEGDTITLYDRLKHHFKFIDTGFKSKKYDIYGYNGGLFAPDKVLDTIIFTNSENLENLLESLNQYNFETDIDINVLGHIFEHSLNEIDQKRTELLEDLEAIEAGKEPKNIGKRKQDGVFYTPIPITKYIIQESVGKLCHQKKSELQILDELLSWDEIENYTENQTKELLEKVEIYQKWLDTVTVLDPACGSGAFLNQVLNFFIYEYEWIENLKTGILARQEEKKQEKEPKKIETNKTEKTNLLSIFDAPLPSVVKKQESNLIHQILENNIFGVDLNTESISITQLSLWLKTAQMRRKLNDLSNNIKVGNSLISDKNIDEKAFDWKKAFKVTDFTVIVGNPPYVRQERLNEKQKDYLQQNYQNVATGTADLYVYFYEKALQLLQKDGILGYITPNKWFKTKYGQLLRNRLKPLDIQKIIDFFEVKVFDDAATEPQIIILKNRNSDNDFDYFPITKQLLGEEGLEHFATKINAQNEQKITIKKENLNPTEWTFADTSYQTILDKITGKKIKEDSKLKQVISLKDYSQNGIYYGIKTGLNKAFIIDKKTKEEIIHKDPKGAELIKPYINGTDIKRWHLEDKTNNFLIFTKRGTQIDDYPAIKNHLLQFYDELKPKETKEDKIGRKGGNYEWFEIQDSIEYHKKFETPKILYIYTAKNHYFFYDEEGFFINNSSYLISNADLFLSVFLNSKVFEFYKRLKFVAYGNANEKGRNKLDYNKMVDVPVPILSDSEKEIFEKKAKQLQVWSETVNKNNQKFSKLIQAEFSISKLSKKLVSWYKLDFAGFQDEITKQKAVFSPKQKLEWIEIFESEQKTIQSLLSQIRKTENELNQLLYDLYGFDSEERMILER